MKTIWKYPLKIETQQIVTRIPISTEILCVQVQNETPCIWVLCDPDEQTGPMGIETFGTGHTIDGANRKYIGTYQLRDGGLVFHVFERKL